MTKTTYSYLLEKLVEVSGWQDPDEALSVNERRDIYMRRAALLRQIADLLPLQFQDVIQQAATRLATRIDDDEGWLNNPKVIPLPIEIKEIIRKGLREGRQEDLRVLGVTLQGILSDVAASGEVTE